MVRPGRPALVNTCPVCNRPVTERDERSRLRGRTYVHLRCATYGVRRLGGSGVYAAKQPALPGPRSLSE